MISNSPFPNGWRAARIEPMEIRMSRARKTLQPAKRGANLWRCPKCRREFAHAGQWHSCGTFTEADYLEGKKPAVLAIYRALADALTACAPVAVSPTKTMVCFKLGSTVVSVRL